MQFLAGTIQNCQDAKKSLTNENQRNHHTLEEAKETCQLNVIMYS